MGMVTKGMDKVLGSMNVEAISKVPRTRDLAAAAKHTRTRAHMCTHTHMPMLMPTHMHMPLHCPRVCNDRRRR